jgi:hypothetical protein
MEKFKCPDPECRNYGKYCRIHITDVEKPREQLEKQYLKIKKKFLADNPLCGVDGCWKSSEDVHHQKGRTGNLLIDTAHFLPVCRAHHKNIEEKPIEAKAQGHSKSRLGVSDKRKHLYKDELK